ncbi:phage repressor protein CI [Vibrio scophthalmi]|uniref:phage repressor protein CI n=1 Tax=Vibrio scophthalmi TaxID=45658 RepID=UPI003AACE315
MSELQAQIPPFDYIGGKQVTERMKIVTNTKDFKALGDILGISKGTISTWHQRGLTPYEVIIRLHLKTGASIRYLALGEGEPFSDKESQNFSEGQNKDLIDISYFELSNGKLVDHETLAFDKNYLDKVGTSNVIAIEDDHTTYIVDKNIHQAVSGTYLVDIDGLLSLNQIQRLPGKKLAISFNGSTLTVEEDEVKVVGRVALAMERT